MNRWVGWLIGLGVAASIAIVCYIRWNAWFGMPAEPEWTGDTINYSFYCFGDDSVPGFVATDSGWQDTLQPNHLRMALFGDIHNRITHAQWDSIYHRHDTIDCYAQVGDFVERGYLYYYQLLYQTLDSTAFASLPLITVPGNHEYQKGWIHRISPLWLENFHNPHNGPQDMSGTTYYVDFPQLRMICLDLNRHNMRDMLRTEVWLRSVLRSAGNRFSVVIMHHPVYSAGAGRQNMKIKWLFASTLSQADIVFAGHDHNYARRWPFVDINSANKYYLGNLSYSFDRVGTGIQLYQIVTVTGDSLLMQTYQIDTGELYDEVLTIRHSNGRREVIDRAQDWHEFIQIPDKYKDRNDLKVRRFNNRKNHRENY